MHGSMVTIEIAGYPTRPQSTWGNYLIYRFSPARAKNEAPIN